MGAAPVSVGVGVSVGGTGVAVGCKGGTNRNVPDGRVLVDRQFPTCSSATDVPKAEAILCHVSSGWIVIGTQPDGILQLLGVETIGVLVGGAVGRGVKVGSPGSWVGITALVLVRVGATANLAPPSTSETARLPKIIAAEIIAASMPKIAWRVSLMFLPVIPIRRRVVAGAGQ